MEIVRTCADLKIFLWHVQVDRTRDIDVDQAKIETHRHTYADTRRKFRE